MLNGDYLGFTHQIPKENSDLTDCMLEVTDKKIFPLSEKAILVEFGSSIDPEILQRVLALRQAIEANPFEGLIETVPTYAALAIYFDPLKVMHSSLAGRNNWERVSGFLQTVQMQNKSDANPARQVLIPVCYEQEFGLDLIDLAKQLGLSIDEIIRLHLETEYTVYMVGFTPGFAYMGSVDQKIESPRKQSPRKQVPAGSVGIAGRQTGIYPFATPGGWQIIGRTPYRLFSPKENPPALLHTGDQVKFDRISAKEFNRLMKP